MTIIPNQSHYLRINKQGPFYLLRSRASSLSLSSRRVLIRGQAPLPHLYLPSLPQATPCHCVASSPLDLVVSCCCCCFFFFFFSVPVWSDRIGMETYFLFRRAADVAPGAAACAEQDEDIGSPSDSESSSPSTSRDSAGSSSSELDDDASSSGSDRRHFEMSTLMAQLPLKRGLSRFFDGKSQSFASLAAVGSLEDLAKPPRKRLKPSRSCGGGLDAHRGRLLSPRRHCPKATAARKVAARSGALAMLGAATRRPPLAAPARPEGVAGKVLVVG